MIMEHIIYVLPLIILASQIPTAQMQYPFLRNFDPEIKKYIKDALEDKLIEKQKSSLKEALESNLKKAHDFPSNPYWLKEDPNKEEIVENYKTYASLCLDRGLNTKKNDEECEVLYENLGARVQSIHQKVFSYIFWVDEAGNDIDKCRNSNRTEHDCDLEKADWERILKEVKLKRLPWSEMYEICISSNTKHFCLGYITFLMLQINPTMKFKDVSQVIKMYICVSSGEPGEECAKNANIRFVYTNDKKQVIVMSKRDSNEL